MWLNWMNQNVILILRCILLGRFHWSGLPCVFISPCGKLINAHHHSTTCNHMKEGMYKCTVKTFKPIPTSLCSLQRCNCCVFAYDQQILKFEGIAAHEQRKKRVKDIYDKFIFADRLSMSSVSWSWFSPHVNVCLSEVYFYAYRPCLMILFRHYQMPWGKAKLFPLFFLMSSGICTNIYMTCTWATSQKGVCRTRTGKRRSSAWALMIISWCAPFPGPSGIEEAYSLCLSITCIMMPM